MAVRAPPSGGWHDPAHAPALAAYAAAVAFESSCAIARVQLAAWPCRECILDNGQFRTMISAHPGLLPPILQPLVGKHRQGWGAGTATHDAGGLPHGSPYFLGQPRLRPWGPEETQGAAQQRRCPVLLKDFFKTKHTNISTRP
jgi:hypothetical protein